MNIPINKNKRWIDSIHKSIDQFSDDSKVFIMKQAGISCVSDILRLCEAQLDHKIDNVQDLVTGWNILRNLNNLKGTWKLEGNIVHGLFYECGCPLVRSGLIDLHPVQCLCSKGMIETIFTKVSKKEVEVILERSIGRGDDVCEFVVKP